MPIKPKFEQIFKNTRKRPKGQTIYLRPNNFWKRSNFHSLAAKEPSSQPRPRCCARSCC